MAKTYYVFSTLANDNRYVQYAKGGDMPIPERSILIKGGAGVANDRLITPAGVVTTVTEEDMAVLKANHVFDMHVRNGHITVREKSADAEKIAVDMNRADPSAPLTAADYGDKNLPQPQA